MEERKKRLIEQERCFRCLRKGHILKNCYIKRNCSYCNGPHNSAICSKRNYSQERHVSNFDNTHHLSYSTKNVLQRNKTFEKKKDLQF